MRCQRCGDEITEDNYTYETALTHEGEEVWCAPCIEQNTYYCECCNSNVDDTLPCDDDCLCPFCQETHSERCASCDTLLWITDYDALIFKQTHPNGDCYAVYDEDYYLKDGKLYCQECWDKMND